MGVTIGDGFKFFRSGTNNVCFTLCVEGIDVKQRSVDFSLSGFNGASSSYQVCRGNTKYVNFPDRTQLRVNIKDVLESFNGQKVTNLRFYTDGAYDWQRFESDPVYRR